MAHCAFRTTLTAVAGDQSFSSLAGTRPNRCSLGGNLSPRSSAMRSAVSKSRRTTGKWMQRSASMPGYCEPSPGKRKASLPVP